MQPPTHPSLPKKAYVPQNQQFEKKSKSEHEKGSMAFRADLKHSLVPVSVGQKK